MERSDIMGDQVSKKVLNRMGGDPPPIVNLHPANHLGEGRVVANMAGLLKLHDLIEQALNALGEADTITMTSQVSESNDIGYKLSVVHVSNDEIKKERPQLAVGIALLKRIYELGLDPADIERWPLLLHSIKTQDDAQELIQAAYTVRDIQQESGLSLPALEGKVKQLGEKAKELETVTAKVGKAKSEINDLVKKREDLTKEVLSLEEKYNWLIPRVQELEQREKLLLNRHESMLIEAEKAKEILGTPHPNTPRSGSTIISWRRSTRV
jgi:hypothetical protein